MKNYISSPKKVSLIVLTINIIFMLITIMNLSQDKIIDYMAAATGRTMFFISLVLGIASLVYTINGKKKGADYNFLLAIVNIVISVMIVLLPAISFTINYHY